MRLLLLLFVVALIGAVTVSYLTVPMQNSTGDHFDALLVLGTPDTFDGKSTMEQTSRVAEAVREYQRGRAEHIVMTGGPTLNHFVEAHTMAATAMQMGVPASAIIEEGRARDTYQNIQYSQRIFDERGWQRVEVISSAEHLHRAAILLRQSHLLWQTHAAPNPKASAARKTVRVLEEAVAVAMLRCFGMKMRPIIHVFGQTQELIKYTLRWLKYAAEDLMDGHRPHIPFRFSEN